MFYVFDSTNEERCYEGTLTDAIIDQLKESCSQGESVAIQIQERYSRRISDSCSDFDERSIDDDDDGTAELDESDDSTLEEENELSRAIDIQQSPGKGSPSGVRRQ